MSFSSILNIPPEKIGEIFRLNEHLDKKVWTILGDTNKRVNGTLGFNGDEIILKFTLQNQEAKEIMGFQEKITSLGKNTRVTLLNSACVNSLENLLVTEEISVSCSPNMAILHNKEKPMPETIHDLSCRIPGIGAWFDQDLLDFDYGTRGFTSKNQQIYHEIPIGDGRKIILQNTFVPDLDAKIINGEFKAHTESSVTIQYTRPKKGAPLDRLITILSYVEDFFNFIFPLPYSAHIFSSETSGKKFDHLYVIRSTNGKRYRLDDRLSTHDMLFKLSDVSNINQVFYNWVGHYEKIHEIVETIILLRTTYLSDEVRFTLIINALESVHRRYFNHTNQTDKDYKDRLDRITSRLETKDARFVKEKLKYGNEISLRQRLKEIIDICEKHGIKRPDEQLVDQVVNTRNYLTHGDKELRPKTLGDFKIQQASNILAIYTKLVLLKILGIKDDELKNIVDNSAQLRPYYEDRPGLHPY
ncbi:MAG: hypothetical protein LBU20_01940 [Candidatus Nomurabacteria bacterium]|jgi:hypothetical protein|nr:hypothetical protein [Candidatus Nomurabacteria bacterium]